MPPGRAGRRGEEGAAAGCCGVNDLLQGNVSNKGLNAVREIIREAVKGTECGQRGRGGHAGDPGPSLAGQLS